MKHLTHNNIKDLLILGFVFVVVLSMCVPQFLFAQDVDPTSVPVSTSNVSNVDTSNVDLNAIADQNETQTYDERQAENDALNQQWQDQVRQEATQAGKAGAGKKDKADSSMGVFETIGRWIGTLLLSIASMFVYVGGTVLDLALTKVVFGMGDLVNRSGFGNSIDTMWKLIRDICNLAFIFAFVFLGIRTIISPDSSSVKRTLAQIIIGSLLINFSLFFVKFVIDFSNLTAYHIYNAMISGSGSLSAKIADVLGIVTFFSNRDPNTFENISGSGGMIWFYILAALLLFIAAFVFIAAAILLVIRFVALILIMIASPILFAATLFPQTAQYSSKLWSKLISYSFFAPVYLLLTLVTITLMQSLGTEISRGGSGFVDAVKNPANGGLDSMGVILNFVIIIFFLIQSFMIAKKIGVAGGDTAVSIGQNLRARGQRYMGNATMGLAAATGRATVGRSAYNISERGGLKDAASRRGLRGFAARQVLKGSRVVSDSSFDSRNVGDMGKKLGIGEGRKGGYASSKKDVEEKEMKFAKSLGEIGDEDTQVETRKKEVEYAKKNLDKERGFLREQMKSKDDTVRADAAKKLSDLEKAHKDAEEGYKQEKQRRVVGSSYRVDTGELESRKKKVKEHEQELKNRWDEYVKMDDGQKNGQRDIIAGYKKGLDEAKESYEVLLKGQLDRGYASVLENGNWLNTLVKGRLVVQEREAGKAIRKAFEKKIKKSKEDTRHEELIDATKPKG